PCDPEANKRDVHEDRLKRVKANRLVLVVRREHQKQHASNQAERVTEGAGHVIGQSRRYRCLRGRSCHRTHFTGADGGPALGAKAAFHLTATTWTECHNMQLYFRDRRFASGKVLSFLQFGILKGSEKSYEAYFNGTILPRGNRSCGRIFGPAASPGGDPARGIARQNH